ncbi:MAG: TlpA family protein disulfide reductase, partial [Rubripirellula sp.]
AGEDAQTIRWQATDFTEPFEFRTSAVKSIKYPSQRAPASRGDFLVELRNGDVIVGRLVGWDEEKVYLKSPKFGELSIRSASITRIHRIEENASLVFASLAGLQDWTPVRTVGWNEDGDRLWAAKPDAVLDGDLGVPERAMIHFQLSWNDRPDFVLTLGGDPKLDGKETANGWRIETAGNQLMLVREHADSADLDFLMDLKNVGSIRLTLYLDQRAGTMQVFLPDGTLAGKVTTPASKKTGTGVRLQNRGRSLTLEKLRIAKWLGDVPMPIEAGQASIALADGSFMAATISKYDPKSKSLEVGSGKNREDVPVTDILAIEFPRSKDDTHPASCAIFLHNGMRLSGSLDSISKESWIIKGQHVDEKVNIARSDVRSLIVFENDLADALESVNRGRVGRLEINGHRLNGHLVPHTADRPDQSTLRWHPFASETASNMTHTAAGRIVYHDEPTANGSTAAARAMAMQRKRLQQQKRGLNFAQLFLRRADSIKKQKVTKDAHVVHIRTGDVIACIVNSIDESGVHVSTNASDRGLVPLDQIKAIELVSGAIPPDLNSAKRDRLLTIPRLQKSEPPTHLLCSQNGDFLRCRLLSMTDAEITVEVQLEVVTIPRSRVSQIISFHPDEWQEEQEAKEQATDEELDTSDVAENIEDSKSLAGFVQTLKRDGKRVTFRPQQVTKKSIAGQSDLLGACSFDIAEVDQVVFGDQIASEVSDLAYNQWKLHPAVEPLVTAAMEGDTSTAGDQSPLVGSDAPPIKLDLLDGEEFVLEEHKGKIVVLDFWASWCAPCMLTMPQVEEAIAEIGSDQVELFAVNLEEPADHVQKVLERHDLKVQVALDLDGVTAQRYQARAIPQLVIISPDGKVHKLFVGGGTSVVEQMKAAINALLEAPAS